MADVPDLLKRLEQGIKDITSSDVFRQYLLTMGKFYKYSFGNCILIALQKSNATYVAGFVQWKEFGRWVKKGEGGISILAPCLPSKGRELETRRKKLEVELGRELYHREIEEIKKAIGEEAHDPIFYKVVYVFDVSQTEGKPLPEIAIPVLSYEPPYGLLDRFQRYRISLGLSYRTDDKITEMGSLSPSTKEIVVKANIPRGQEVKTLAHELAHWVAGSRVGYAQGEVLAESVAFIVCGHFGFDTGVRSFPYVALWAKDLEVLKKNLLNIQKIAEEMIERVEGI